MPVAGTATAQMAAIKSECNIVSKEKHCKLLQNLKQTSIFFLFHFSVG